MAIYRSKLGYHPISFESSEKLRFVGGIYVKSKKIAGSWERWEHKKPDNRWIKRNIIDSGRKIGTELVEIWEEPKICSLFHDAVPSRSWWLSSEKKPAKGFVPGYAQDNGLGGKILIASKQARTPQSNPEDVQPFIFTEEEINNFYELAKEWAESCPF